MAADTICYNYNFCVGEREYQFLFNFAPDPKKLSVTEESTRLAEVRTDLAHEVPKKEEEFVVVNETNDGAKTHAAADDSGTTTYEIDVTTGDVSGAGTDANVFIIIYGEKSDTGKIMLCNSTSNKHKFEREQTDSFVETAPNVGKLQKIRVGHDNKGGFAGWYLDTVTVNIPSLNCKWTCPAKRWLDKKEGDKQIECDIYPTLVEETYVDIIYEEVKLEDLDSLKNKDVASINQDGDTTVSVKTGHEVNGDGTQMVVEEITTTTTSHEIETHLNMKTDVSSAIGTSLAHIESKPLSKHHTFKVAPYNEPANNRKWRSATVDDVLDSLDEAKEAMKDNDYYLCTLKDGYIGGKEFKYEISGDVKKQDHRLLVQVDAEPSEDIVTVQEVTEVESGNDDMLDQLIADTETSVTVNTTEEVVSCELVTEVESSPSDFLCEDENASGKDAESDAMLHANADILVKSVIETVTSTITMTTYDIDVRTGDKSGAGTDANVFVILVGDKSTSDKIILKDSKTHKKMFERDQVDSFTIECVDVGNIKNITIGHDNKGGFAGWYLFDVVISGGTTGERLTFVADRWLDKKEADKKLEVELYPLETKDLTMTTHDGYVDVKVETKSTVEVEEEVISFETTEEVHNEDESFLDKLDNEASASVHVDVSIKKGSDSEDSEGEPVDEDLQPLISDDDDEEEARTLFQQFDVDGDGRITMEEFMAKLKAEKKRKKKEKKERKREKKEKRRAEAEAEDGDSSDSVPSSNEEHA